MQHPTITTLPTTSTTTTISLPGGQLPGKNHLVGASAVAANRRPDFADHAPTPRRRRLERGEEPLDDDDEYNDDDSAPSSLRSRNRYFLLNQQDASETAQYGPVLKLAFDALETPVRSAAGGDREGVQCFACFAVIGTHESDREAAWEEASMTPQRRWLVVRPVVSKTRPRKRQGDYEEEEENESEEEEEQGDEDDNHHHHYDCAVPQCWDPPPRVARALRNEADNNNNRGGGDRGREGGRGRAQGRRRRRPPLLLRAWVAYWSMSPAQVHRLASGHRPAVRVAVIAVRHGAGEEEEEEGERGGEKGKGMKGMKGKGKGKGKGGGKGKGKRARHHQ